MTASDVNGRRTYDNSGRLERAEATRSRILDAAHRVLVQRGYSATTVNAIAREARASRETIYKAYGTKLGLVKQLYDVRLAGDADDLPLNERPEWAAMVSAATGAGVLAAYASIVRGLYTRLGSLLGVLLLAARSGEPDLQTLGDETDTQRLVGATRVVDHVAARERLRTGVDRRQAIDVVWTLNSPDVYALLSRSRGWSDDEYERWLRRSLIDALLNDESRRTPGRLRP